MVGEQLTIFLTSSLFLQNTKMKLNKFSLIAGIVFLSVATNTFAANAQSFSSQSQIIAQAQPAKKARFEKFAQELGLTDEQQSQLTAIREKQRSEIDKILTPEQRQLRQTAMQNRQGRRAKFQALNLSDSQKNEIKKIMASSKQDMEAILTPEQKQKFEQIRSSRRERRQQTNR
jgi:periplasmic protein CpxP/Spy